MSDLPQGWRRSRLGQHLREPIRNGYSPVCPKEPTGKWIASLGAVSEDGFRPRAVKPAPLADPRVDAAKLEPGDLVVSRSNTRERVGLAGIYEGSPPCCSYPDLLMRVRTTPDLDQRFLLFTLLSRMGRRYFHGAARGTSGSMVKIDRALLENFPVVVPPLAEQRVIATALKAVDDIIVAAGAVLEELRRLRTGVHAALCTGRLDTARPRRTGPWGEMPSEWREAQLGELATSVRSPCIPNPGSKYVEIGVRSHGKGVFLKEAVDGAILGAKRVFFVEPGCLVVNIVFAWEGAVAVTTDEHRGTIASHRFPMYRPVEGTADPRFLRHILLTQPGLRVLGVASPGGAGRNRTLNQDMLLRTHVPCPPLREQQAIADTLDDLDRRIAADGAVLDQYRTVKSALSTALISGRLRTRDIA